MDRLRTPPEPTDPAAYKQVLITIPTHVDLERFLWGAFSVPAYWTSWVEEGMSIEDAANLVKEVLASRMEFSLLGTIVAVYIETLHISMLLCDGSTYNKVDYPDLWEVLPASAKTATTFTVPDLQSRFVLGASNDYPEGDSGGEAEVTLVVSQMPSHSHTNVPHSHSEVTALPSVAQLPVVPVPTATPAVGVTGASGITINNTGGDQPHNNLPPYFALRYAIIAKVQP